MTKFANNVIQLKPKTNYKKDIIDTDRITMPCELQIASVGVKHRSDILGSLPEVTQKSQNIEELRTICGWYETVISEMYDKITALSDAYNIDIAETVKPKKEPQ